MITVEHADRASQNDNTKTCTTALIAANSSCTIVDLNLLIAIIVFYILYYLYYIHPSRYV